MQMDEMVEPKKRIWGFCGRGSPQLYIWPLACGAITVFCAFVIRHQAPASVRYSLVAAAVVCIVLYIRAFARELRRFDELQLRILLEAASVACLGTFGFGLMYPVLKMAGLIHQLDPSDTATLLALLAAGGYLFASRRYR